MYYAMYNTNIIFHYHIFLHASKKVEEVIRQHNNPDKVYKT